MRVTGHIAVGAASYLYAATLLPEHPVFNSGIVLWYVGLFLTLFGSLLPDIDTPESTFGSKVKIVSYPLSLIFGHRGITHSLIAIAGIFYVGYYFSVNTFYNGAIIVPCLALGYLSHILSDLITPKGVPLLYPYRRRFSIPIIRNGLIEVFVYVLIFSGSVWCYFNVGPMTLSASTIGFR